MLTPGMDPHPGPLTRTCPSCHGCSVLHVPPLPSSPAGPTPSRSCVWGGVGGQGHHEPLGWRGTGGIIPLFPAFTNEPAIFVSGL